MIYKEVARDWLDDPLATNFKFVFRRIGKPVPIPDSVQAFLTENINWEK
jgi:hypothetical protein